MVNPLEIPLRTSSADRISLIIIMKGMFSKGLSVCFREKYFVLFQVTHQ